MSESAAPTSHAAASRSRSLSPEVLEQQFVHNVYNTIAPHFSHTRFSVRTRHRVIVIVIVIVVVTVIVIVIVMDGRRLIWCASYRPLLPSRPPL